MDGDGNQEIIVQSNDGMTHMLKIDGTEAQGFPWPTQSIPMGVAVGDVDGDGDLELVITDQTHLYVLAGFGDKKACKIEWGQYRHDNWGTSLHGFVPPSRQWRPSPKIADGATGLEIGTILKWYYGDSGASYSVYFGTNPKPGSAEYRGTRTSTEYNPGTLAYGTTYFWRIDTIKSGVTTTGPTWSFTTEPKPIKALKPINPYPANGAKRVFFAGGLSATWQDGGGATSYDIYYGTNPNPGSSEYRGNTALTSYGLGNRLEYNTTYYWRIDAKNRAGTTMGNVWRFTTRRVVEPGVTPSLLLLLDDD